MIRDDRKLEAARGIFYGLVFGLVCWGLIAAVIALLA